MSPRGTKVDDLKTEVSEFGGEERRRFTNHLLRDLKAMDHMLAENMFEEGVRRVGAEQEMFLIDRGWHPAPAATQVLELVSDPHFTTELGLFNLEFNLDPLPFEGSCLSEMEKDLVRLMRKLRKASAKLGIDAVLTGILPTLHKSDLGLDSMTPNPRFIAFNQVMSGLRGGVYDIYIKGLDELTVTHDSIMLEACNASFQAHLQVDASNFPNMYNIAQAITGPVLAAVTNSPLLFGHRLWAETRIALFPQSVDTRRPGHQPREQSPRVMFGTQWLRRSVLEMYKEDLRRFRAIVGADLDEDPFERLEHGDVPELQALKLYNGTVYRWNRACYGMTGGKPHMRIEYRPMPSGPTITDEVANAALWFGLMEAMGSQYEDITREMRFEHAKLNFLHAARLGLAANFTWLKGEDVPATTLLLDKLIPMAAEGLDARGIDPADRDKYLGIVERRVQTRRTGSRWILESLHDMRRGTSGQRLNTLVAGMVSREKEGRPVADWEPATLTEVRSGRHNYFKIEQYMQTDLITVHPDDPVDLVANLMQWEKVRHIPVEDHEHRLVGLVSYRHLLRLLTENGSQSPLGVAVAEIMIHDPIHVGPNTSTARAIQIMREHRIGALPVTYNGRLVGVVTERDFMDMAAQLLEEKLSE